MKAFIAFVCSFFMFITYAQEAKTLSFKEGMQSPAASIEAAGWLAGHWRGEAFGGIAEELWSPPLGESMMFAFKLVVEGKVSFYELGAIIQTGETLVLKLKHFHGDLRGWEEKDETVDFPLVKITNNTLYFDGFTIERVNDEEINIHVLMKEQGTEITFHYKKV